jgi:hypothetical protein
LSYRGKPLTKTHLTYYKIRCCIPTLYPLINTKRDTKPKSKRAEHLSPDGKWRSFPKVPNLLQYVSTGAYYARQKVAGKLIHAASRMQRLRKPSTPWVISKTPTRCRNVAGAPSLECGQALKTRKPQTQELRARSGAVDGRGSNYGTSWEGLSMAGRDGNDKGAPNGVRHSLALLKGQILASRARDDQPGGKFPMGLLTLASVHRFIPGRRQQVETMGNSKRFESAPWECEWEDARRFLGSLVSQFSEVGSDFDLGCWLDLHIHNCLDREHWRKAPIVSYCRLSFVRLGVSLVPASGLTKFEAISMEQAKLCTRLGRGRKTKKNPPLGRFGAGKHSSFGRTSLHYRCQPNYS